MLGIRGTVRSARTAALMVAVLMFALMVPAVASATVFAFKTNQLVNGGGDTQSYTTPSQSPPWYFTTSRPGNYFFMTDSSGWAVHPINGWTATPVAFDTLWISRFDTPWSCLSLDVRNNGATPVNITVTATAGGATHSQVVSVDPGIESVSLTGFTNVLGHMTVQFPLSSDVSFNNIDLVTFSATAPPTVSTGSASSISSTGATVAGNVTDAGGTAVTERGICYSTTGTPTISSPKVAAGTGAGAFTATLSGLSPSTTYNARSFATNSNGTSYGLTTSFTTSAAPPAAPPTVSVPSDSPWSIILLAASGIWVLAVIRRRQLSYR